jgi:virginiamycin B lyase
MKTAPFRLSVPPARASLWVVATLLIAPFLGCAGGGGGSVPPWVMPTPTPTPTPAGGQAHKEQLKTPANTPPPITYNASFAMPEPFDPNEYLSGIQMGSDGNIWASEYDGDAIARFTPTGVTTAFPIQTASSGPADMTLAPDGNIWFSESLSNKIAKVSPAGAITEYPLDPTIFPNPGTEGPRGITVGPDGNIWFEHTNASKIGRMTLTGVLINSYAFTSGSGGGRVTAGPDGNMWFTETSTSKIARINVATGQITEFPTPTANSYPHTIVQAADGNLWFTERDASQVASITTSGFITEYTTPTKIAFPLYMTTTPDGSLWFAEYLKNGICRVDPLTLTMVEYVAQVPGGVLVRGITPGPSSSIWATDDAHDAVVDFGAPESATPGHLIVHKRSPGRIR